MDRESELHAEKMNLSVELDSCRAICGQLTHDMARLRDEVDGLIAAAVRAERERLIPLVCRRCSLGRSPSRPKSQVEPYAGWVHMTAVEVFNCPASPIHEALRESAEEQENG